MSPGERRSLRSRWRTCSTCGLERRRGVDHPCIGWPDAAAIERDLGAERV